MDTMSAFMMGQMNRGREQMVFDWDKAVRIIKDFKPTIMDTMSAFMMGQMNRGREQMVFDWDKAARIIKDFKPTAAHAGLSGDLENTEGMIFADGQPEMGYYTYLASTWATPILILCDPDKETIEYPCFIMKSETEWDAKTKWPQSALDILNS